MVRTPIMMKTRRRTRKRKISDLIIERDNYKNRLEEVQEAFRCTEMLRATKYDQFHRGNEISFFGPWIFD